MELLSPNVTSIEMDVDACYTYLRSLNANATSSLEFSADLDRQNELLNWGIVRFQLTGVESSIV